MLQLLAGCPGQSSDSLMGNGNDNPAGQDIPDTDGDGVADTDDRCDETPANTAVDIFGCPSELNDSDDDGVVDDDDLCPATDPADQVDERGCGPDQSPDADADGIADANDQCPETPENAVVNSDGCAISQLDSDGDGLADDLDQCSDTNANAVIDEDGCASHQRDGDGDGVTDNNDDCLDTPPSTNVDLVGCPVGRSDAPDTDGDGVNNDVDLCPASPADVEVDGNGCTDEQRDGDGDGIPDSEDRCPDTAAGETVGADGCVLPPVTSGGGNPGGGNPGGGDPDCSSAGDCDDLNPCTVDICSSGSCSNTSIDGCTPCTLPTDCDDQDPCTSDLCSAHGCSNPPIDGCVACDGPTICPPIEVVFLMNTSTFMVDEGAALCSNIASVLDEAAALGVDVTPHLLGITTTRNDLFPCLTDNVIDLLGYDVPGTQTSCAFPDNLSSSKSWGPATAIVAERFSWSAGAMRVIVPLSDEGPCNGSFPEGCNDPGDDRESIDNAIEVANANNVIVSPVAGTGSSDCVLSLASLIADGTGGVMIRSQDPAADIAGAISSLIVNACMPDFSCDDTNPCTEADTCADGVCAGVDIPDCVRCDVPEDCDDSNACTNDLCVDGVCKSEPQIDGTACDDNAPCTADGSCLSSVCVGNPVEGCVRCELNSECEDENACTDNECLAGECNYPTNYDEFTLCCDPATGELQPLEEPIVQCPESVITNAAAGRFSAEVQWDPTTAFDGCGMADLVCTGSHNDVSKEDMDELIDQGGQLPSGLSQFECSVVSSMVCEGTTDPCFDDLDCENSNCMLPPLVCQRTSDPCLGDSDCCDGENCRACVPALGCEWNVNVKPTSLVRASLELEPLPNMNPGPVERCVEFEFFSNCLGNENSSVVVERSISLGFPFDAPGRAEDFEFEVPAGSYSCVEARDPLHTVRSVLEPVNDNGVFVLDFTGDPRSGGSWLRVGDLNDVGGVDVGDSPLVDNAFNPIYQCEGTTIPCDNFTPCPNGACVPGKTCDGEFTSNRCRTDSDCPPGIGCLLPIGIYSLCMDKVCDGTTEPCIDEDDCDNAACIRPPKVCRGTSDACLKDDDCLCKILNDDKKICRKCVASADFNADGVVDDLDVEALLANFPAEDQRCCP